MKSASAIIGAEVKLRHPLILHTMGSHLMPYLIPFDGPRHHLLPVVHIRWITLVSQLLVLIQSIVPSNVCFQCFQCDTVVTLTSNFEATFDIPK